MFFKEEELETKRIDSNTFRRVLAYGEGLMNALITFEKGLNPETEIPYIAMNMFKQLTYLKVHSNLV